MGIGAVLRVCNGGFVSTIQMWKPHDYQDVKLIEAIALRKSLDWLKSSGVYNVSIKVDSLVVLQAVLSDEPDVSPFGLVISNCKCYCNEINGCQISHVRNSANHVAHVLAREADSLSRSLVWSSATPSISHVLLNDLI